MPNSPNPNIKKSPNSKSPKTNSPNPKKKKNNKTLLRRQNNHQLKQQRRNEEQQRIKDSILEETLEGQITKDINSTSDDTLYGTYDNINSTSIETSHKSHFPHRCIIC
jgi:hypothetical protein